MKKIILLMLMASLFACKGKPETDTLVLFMEQENGVDPFQTRMIINKNFIRIDSGEGDNNFVLFDRVKKVVFSVNPDEQRIMAIHEKKLKEGQVFSPPFELKHSVKALPEMKDAPTINGETAKRYKLITNNKTCYDVVAIKGLMPHVVKALIEFNEMMATDSVLTFNNIPADMHDACEMTKTTFKPARKFEFGFPIQEWGNREYMRSLVDYNLEFKTDPKLFVLPAGYHNYTVQELREGKVDFND
ncbi:MAG: hypothetical protein QM484_05330 [Woeseiaceae bacterium]